MMLVKCTGDGRCTNELAVIEHHLGRCAVLPTARV